MHEHAGVLDRCKVTMHHHAGVLDRRKVTMHHHAGLLDRRKVTMHEHAGVLAAVWRRLTDVAQQSLSYFLCKWFD